MTSFLFLCFVWQRQRWAFVAASINGIGFCLVYVLDLARWFPVSPDAMPPVLLAIEVLGTILSIPLVALAMSAANVDGDLSNNNQRHRDLSDTMAIDGASVDKLEKLGLLAVIAVAAFLGTGIVIFATRSAMGL